MPLALLLSPDDQAVSAITAVLEEMSVTCERPLDGVAAAKQLNSHNFDLVIVDCENLPAAKLIFDVCRRGTGGKNPVPIAIVNGRAGLPTAFRLGAELILTKPVAKDQARGTVRAAVNRVKKEQPVSVSQTGEKLSADAIPGGTSNTGVESTEAQRSEGAAAPAAAEVPPESRALAAAASAQGQSICQPETMAASASVIPAMSTAASATEPEVAAAAESTIFPDKTRTLPALPPSDDPVLAELERTEAEPEPKSPASVPSAEQEDRSKKSKTRGPLVALVALALISSGLYAAWTTQPGFRTFAEPQIDRVLTLVGMAQYAQTPVPAPIAAKRAAQPVPAVAPSSLAESAPASPTAATSMATTAPVPSTAGSTTPATSQASLAPNTVAQPASVTAKASNGIPVAMTPAIHANKTDGDKAAAALNAGSQKSTGRQKSADSKNSSPAIPAEAGVSADATAVVLSSKGAEKRLIHSVPPSYPASAGGAEGTVVVKAMVDENGKVSSAQVVDGNAALAEAAVTAVKQWRYRPYLQDGKTVPFQTILDIDVKRP